MTLVMAMAGCVIHARSFDDEATFDDDVLAVEAWLGSGDVVVGRGAENRVAWHVEHSGSEPSVSATFDDGRLVLTSECDERLYCVVSWDVELAGDAELALATGSGDIELVDVAGAALSAETGSGDVIGDGDFAVAELSTGSGDVVFTFGASATTLEATTGSGDVDLEVPRGSWQLDVETGSGDEALVGVSGSQTASRTLRARTGSGDVTVSGR